MLRRCVLGLAAVAAVPRRAGAADAATDRAVTAPAVVDVAIRDYRFEPAALTIKAGTTVRWTNHEKRTTHSVRFLGPGGIESERFFPGESWERRFDAPGRYPYSCGPHPEMAGEVVVVVD